MKIMTKFKHQGVQGFKLGSTPLGKPNMFSHFYFIDGMLIDTGHSNMQSAVSTIFKQLNVHQVFITHHHEDHTGNLALAQDYFDCPTYASAKCVELMKKPPKISFAQWLIWGDRPPNVKIQTIDSQIKTENYTFELIPVPGHADDMVCLYEPNQGWLFSADLWVNDYIRFFMRTESMKTQIESMKKIQKLDYEVPFCCHNPQFEGGKERMAKKIEFMEDFYGRASAEYHKGFPPTEIMKNMGIKESWPIRIVSGGALSTLNMVKAVIRDEEQAKNVAIKDKKVDYPY